MTGEHTKTLVWPKDVKFTAPTIPQLYTKARAIDPWPTA